MRRQGFADAVWAASQTGQNAMIFFPLDIKTARYAG